MTKDKLIELAQVGMGIHSPNQPEYIVCEALIKALAQPKPWENFCDLNCVWTDHHPDCKLAQRKPLTDEEIRKANHHMVDGAYDYSFKQGVKWAEYKHGIKENT